MSVRWINVKDQVPADKERVLAFSPLYAKDDPMRYRILEGQFLKLCREVTHWISLTSLSDEGETKNDHK